MRNVLLFGILPTVLIFLIIVALFMFTTFEVHNASDEFYSNEISIDFDSYGLHMFVADEFIPQVYYDEFGDTGYIVIYLDLGGGDIDFPTFGKMQIPTVALVYDVGILDSVIPRNYQSLKDYIYNAPIQLSADKLAYSALVPYALRLDLANYSYVNPFYFTIFLNNKNHFPPMYTLNEERLEMTITLEVLDDNNYNVYWFGAKKIIFDVNSQNVAKGLLGTISTNLRLSTFPQFDTSADNIFEYIKAFGIYTNDIVNYFMQIVSSFFYGFMPFYYLR